MAVECAASPQIPTLYISAIQYRGKPPEFPLENAVQNMRIIDAIFRSAKAGGWEKV